MDIPVLYEDAALLVVNKPAGLPVHAGPKGGENVETIIQARFDPRRRLPHLAHRLDRDTSGCLVFGKTQPALKRLNHIFATRQVKKTYLTITQGVPAQVEGRIKAPMAKRSDDPRSWWMEVNEKTGQEAETFYKVLAASETHAFIECRPRTGRTHQIRVHMMHIGCPIVGDTIYGDKNDAAGLMLHAASIVLPFGDVPLEMNAEVPEAFQNALDYYRLNT